MTAAELIKKLEELPPETKVYREGGEYRDDFTPLRSLRHFKYYSLQGVIVT